jgi:hypothetical protein
MKGNNPMNQPTPEMIRRIAKALANLPLIEHGNKHLAE